MVSCTRCLSRSIDWGCIALRTLKYVYRICHRFGRHTGNATVWWWVSTHSQTEAEAAAQR